MSKQSVGIAIVAALLAIGCGGDENNENSSNSTNSGSNDTSNQPNNTNTSNEPNNESNVNGTPQAWTAELSGGDVDLPEPGGPTVLVVEVPGSVTITGSQGSTGTNLSITLNDVAFEPGDITISDFRLGYGLDPKYRCGGTEVVLTLTSTDPAAGTFAGPVTCEDLPDAAAPFEATVSGQFSE